MYKSNLKSTVEKYMLQRAIYFYRRKSDRRILNYSLTRAIHLKEKDTPYIDV